MLNRLFMKQVSLDQVGVDGIWWERNLLRHLICLLLTSYGLMGLPPLSSLLKSSIGFNDRPLCARVFASFWMADTGFVKMFRNFHIVPKIRPKYRVNVGPMMPRMPEENTQSSLLRLTHLFMGMQPIHMMMWSGTVVRVRNLQDVAYPG